MGAGGCLYSGSGGLCGDSVGMGLVPTIAEFHFQNMRKKFMRPSGETTRSWLGRTLTLDLVGKVLGGVRIDDS